MVCTHPTAATHNHLCVHAADDPAQLSREEKLALLGRLRDAMKQMHAQPLLQPAQVHSKLPPVSGMRASLALMADATAVTSAESARGNTCLQTPVDDRGGGAQPLQDVSNGAHRMNSSAVAVRKQRAGGGSGAERQAKRSRNGGVIAPAPKQ